MNISWGTDIATSFVTNIGLITSNGPIGSNIMSAEWTHHVSYEPGLISICVRPSDATHENIIATKEFGVHLAASDQNVLASVAGSSSGRNVMKIKVLEELGFTFYQAKKINVQMVEGALVNLECKVLEQHTIGDHTLFVGEVLEASFNPSKTALVFNRSKYWKFGEQIVKPPQEELDRIKQLTEKYTRLR